MKNAGDFMGYSWICLQYPLVLKHGKLEKPMEVEFAGKIFQLVLMFKLYD